MNKPRVTVTLEHSRECIVRSSKYASQIMTEMVPACICGVELILQRIRDLEAENRDLELLIPGMQKRIDSWSSDELRMCDRIGDLENVLDGIQHYSCKCAKEARAILR